MYPVSNRYKSKMLDQVQTHVLNGTIHHDFAFSDDDVIGVDYTNQCSDKKVAIGSVNIGVLKLTFLRDILNRGDYHNKEITLTDSLLIGYDEFDEPIFESVPIGVFWVGDAVHTGPDMVDITAYDCLSLMDKPLNIGQTSGYIYDFCKAIETETGAVFGMTQEECEALPNGDDLISPFTENDMTTFRDLLSKLAQMVGGFAYADRDGSFRLKSFDNSVVITIPKNRRISGSKFSDYQTRFDAISYVDVKTTGETKFVGDETGFVMELGNNPFLQYGTPSFINERATEIYQRVQLMRYTPYEVPLLPAFIALDLGDVIAFEGDYTSDTSTGALMSLTWTYNKTLKVRCYGSNPNLRNAQSSSDHAIKGASSANKEGRLLTFKATNIQEIEVESIKRSILSALFSTSSTQPVLTLTEVKFDLDSPGTVEVFYVLDEEEIAYTPIETYSEAGTHTISLMYPLDVSTINVRHRFEVRMKTSSGLVIEPEYAHLYIQGTGFDMTGGFDGYIEVLDDFTAISFGYMEPIALTDNVIFTKYSVEPYQVSDSIEAYNFEPLKLVSFTDNINIYKQSGFKRVTEDGYQRITEDGYRRITE